MNISTFLRRPAAVACKSLLLSSLCCSFSNSLEASEYRWQGQDIQQPGGLAIIMGDEADKLAMSLSSTSRWLVRIVASSPEQAQAFRNSTNGCQRTGFGESCWRTTPLCPRQRQPRL